MNHFYEFAAFRVEMEKRLLWKDGKAIRLKPKTFDTLVFLLENRNKVVTKDEMVGEVWNGMAVSDDSLTQQISQLRKILDDGEHQLIATVSGIGYEFAAEVREVKPSANNDLLVADSNGNLSAAEKAKLDESKTASEIYIQNFKADEKTDAHHPKSFLNKFNRADWRVWTVIFAIVFIGVSAVFLWRWQKAENNSGLGVRRIAVLPFKAVIETDEINALKQGMTDALITRLSRIEKITVLPTSLVAQYNQPNQDPLVAAKELNVDAVLEGRIQKEGERISVTAQLIRSYDGKVLWSEVFLNDFTDIFDVQHSIAYKVAEALSLELSDEEKRAIMKRHTTSTEAYRLYLEGYFFFRRRTADGKLQAQKNFQQAIEIDPNFALAYTGLALLYLEQSNISPKDAYKKSEIYARQALKIDPELAEANALLGFALWRGEWNWKDAEQNFKRAVELKPNSTYVYNWYAMLLSATGKHNEALVVLDNAPNFDDGKANLTVYNFARDYERCIEVATERLLKNPNSVVRISTLSMCYAGKRMFPEAIEAAEKAVALEELVQPNMLAILGSIYAQAGKIEKAREIQRKLEQMPETTANIYGAKAVMYAALGEKDQAFSMLKKSIEQREWWGYTLKVYVFWDSLRDDARFEEMLGRVNLAE